MDNEQYTLHRLDQHLADKKVDFWEVDLKVAIDWIRELLKERDDAREEARKWKAGYERLKGAKG